MGNTYIFDNASVTEVDRIFKVQPDFFLDVNFARLFSLSAKFFAGESPLSF